ncbi:MAG: helix-turn-helix domain-containing protein [Candidatus Limnocylindrales bacterium]|jgi:excisionase family DNA binding protein
MTVRLARPASPDPEAKRQAAEERIRAACSLLADALVELATAAPAVEQPIELLSVEEAARRLGGIARSTLYQLMGTGAVRSVEVGGRRFVPSSEVEAIAAGRPRPGRGGKDAA